MAKGKIVACARCSDTKGLCGLGDKIKSFFVLTLVENFEEMTLIPCYARANFLRKFAIESVDHEKDFVVEVVTEEGFEFNVECTNKDGRTYLEGRDWREFARVYNLDVGTELVFSTDTQGPSTSVRSINRPITHPSYYNLTKDKKDILDAMHATDQTIINWRMMESVVSYVDIIDTMVDKHGAGPYEVGKCESLIHTLSWTSCVKKELKLQRRLVSEDMADYGDLTIVRDKYTKVKGSYTISPEDGRVCCVGWREVMLQEEDFRGIGDKMFSMLYVRRKGPFLFAFYVPNVEL